MSASILVTGTIFRCEEKKSGAGKMFVVGALKVFSENASEFWNFTVFSDTAKTELLRLGIGEKVSLQGALKIETYVKDGETRVSLKVVADHVLALRQPAKTRAPKPKPAPAVKSLSSRTNGDDYFPDDVIPF